jgi:uncharacterized protein involved in response to NO
VGAIGLAIYLVIVIAGYAHNGLSNEGRSWLIVGVPCPVLAAIVRTMAWLHAEALLWCVAFGLMAVVHAAGVVLTADRWQDRVRRPGGLGGSRSAAGQREPASIVNRSRVAR